MARRSGGIAAWVIVVGFLGVGRTVVTLGFGVLVGRKSIKIPRVGIGFLAGALGAAGFAVRLVVVVFAGVAETL